LKHSRFAKILFNDLLMWVATYCPIWPVRRLLLAKLGVRVGKGTRIEVGTVIRGDTIIGDRCYIGNGCVLEGHSQVGDCVRIESQCHITSYSTIGDYVFIAPFFASTNDNRMTYRRRGHGENFKGVTIGRKARIAAHVVTLPGVVIGEGAIVGAASLVTKDVKPYVLVRGSPAKECEDRQGLLTEEITIR
jgi:acetyltransferase-like isoleucine patch superfamily enzyme